MRKGDPDQDLLRNMASFNQVREVATDMKEKVATFKAALDAIDTIVAAWTVDGLDAALPADEVVKAQLLAYDNLAKPAISMNEALAAVRAAT